MQLNSSFPWCQAERDYWDRLKKPVNWVVVTSAKYDNKTYAAQWYEATNWNEKSLSEKISVIKARFKNGSMMGRFNPAPFRSFPTAENTKERLFKEKFDLIERLGYKLDIPWKDYLGATHFIKFY